MPPDDTQHARQPPDASPEFDGLVSDKTTHFDVCAARQPWQATCSIDPAMLDRIADTLEHYMDLLSLRQKIVASNIANADTPGYKTRDLDFQAEFRAVLAGSSPQASEVSGLAIKNDGNNVNLDREARLLSENALRFNLAAGLMREQIRMVKDAIQEGKNA